MPRDQYEVVWIELRDRVVPEALEKADIVITCGQRGTYHKHAGYNEGLLRCSGDIVTICDSDAVYPANFIASILNVFHLDPSLEPAPHVLMHYEYRTGSPYPDDLANVSRLADYSWLPLWENVGACMSVRKIDAFRFGGFDEHHSLRGYFCGPYDLGWRLINAGVPELWHDASVALWHFAHPAPSSAFANWTSARRLTEVKYPPLNGHAYTLVEAFSSGRLLPLAENPEIFARRMEARRIGSALESGLSHLPPQSFGRRPLARLQLEKWRDGARVLGRAIPKRLIASGRRLTHSARRVAASLAPGRRGGL